MNGKDAAPEVTAVPRELSSKATVAERVEGWRMVAWWQRLLNAARCSFGAAPLDRPRSRVGAPVGADLCAERCLPSSMRGWA